MPDKDVLKSYYGLVTVDVRDAGEHAYALAVLYHQSGEAEKAKDFAQTAKFFLSKCSGNSPLNEEIGGIKIPSQIDSETIDNIFQ